MNTYASKVGDAEWAATEWGTSGGLFRYLMTMWDACGHSNECVLVQFVRVEDTLETCKCMRLAICGVTMYVTIPQQDEIWITKIEWCGTARRRPGATSVHGHA